MKKTNQDERFIWRVEDIYETNDEFFADCERAKLKLRKLSGFKGKLNNKSTILEYLKLEEDLEKMLEKIQVYAYMNKSALGATNQTMMLNAASTDVSVRAGAATAFSSEEISKLENDQLRAMAKDPDFASFKRALEFMIKNKPHIRNDEVEKLVSNIGAFTDFEDSFQTLSDIEMPISDLMLKNGKRIPLSNSNYTKFIHSPERAIRKQAYNKLHEAYRRLNITYANSYLNKVKYANFITQTYNFKSTFERSCFYDEADSNILKVMLESVHEALPILQKMQKLRKKALNLPDFSIFDLFAPLTSEPLPKYYYNKATKIILNSLSPMGQDYVTLIEHALTDRWVDLYPAKNKDSSCYCINCFNVHPFVLTNFNNTGEAVSTLSHELGHAMQGYLAGMIQPFSTFECSRLTCEIASTVNEILTRKYLIDNTEDLNEKIAAIDSLLGDFYGAIFKQSLYTEFELFVFSKIEAGENLTFQHLNNKYKELLETYFGKTVEIPDNSAVEWSRIPHFYSPFYVYKYVVGFVSAIIICGNLLSGDKEYQQKYLNFLKAGSSKSPKELLKEVGVDLLDKNTYTRALKLYDLYIDELESVLNKEK